MLHICGQVCVCVCVYVCMYAVVTNLLFCVRMEDTAQVTICIYTVKPAAF